MPIPKRIINFLDERKIKYEIIEHKTVYTAFDKVATLKVLPKIVGKTLVVEFDKNYGLALIGADKILDKIKFKKMVNSWLKEKGKKPAKSIDFVKESWMKKNLKGVKVGAIPPFGEIWKLPTFVDKSFLKNKKMIINGGDYHWSIEISAANLKKTIKDSIIGNFSKKISKKK